MNELLKLEELINKSRGINEYCFTFNNLDIDTYKSKLHYKLDEWYDELMELSNKYGNTPEITENLKLRSEIVYQMLFIT